MLKMVEPQDGSGWVPVSWLGRKAHTKGLSTGTLQEWLLLSYLSYCVYSGVFTSAAMVTCLIQKWFVEVGASFDFT